MSQATDTIKYAYVLRVCGPNGESPSEFARGFVWPLTIGAEVVASDWRATEECGHGLHGWFWGVGSVKSAGATDAARQPESKWLVLKVVEADVIALDQGAKCKFPRCEIVFVGTMAEAAAELVRLGATGPVIGSTLTGGDGSTLTGGDGSTLTGGNRSTLTGGNRSTLLFTFWDDSKGRWRNVMAEIGEAHCEAGVAYVCRDGKIVRKDSVPA